jgi:hypothetical protein
LAVEAGFLQADDARALNQTDYKAAKLIEEFLARGITDDQIALLLACALALPFAPVDRVVVDPEVIGCIPEDVQLRYHVLPLRETPSALYVAMMPERSAAISKFLTTLLRRPVLPVAASAAAIERARAIHAGRRQRPTNAMSVDAVDLDMPVSAYEIFPSMVGSGRVH